MYSNTRIKKIIVGAKDLREIGDLIKTQIILLKEKDTQLTGAGITTNTRIDTLQTQVNLKLKNLEDRIKALENKLT